MSIQPSLGFNSASFSESTDVAADHPEKLAELIEMFDEEAWKYNVYPLYDDMIARISKQLGDRFAALRRNTLDDLEMDNANWRIQ